MPLKYRRKRWYNRIYLAAKNSLSWHNVAVFSISAILLVIITPILLVTFFSSAYASELEPEEYPSTAVIYATTSVVSIAELEQKLSECNSQKVYVFGNSPQELTESASKLDNLGKEIEFVPDYGAKTLSQLCSNLAEEKIKELVVLGSKFEVMQISYACENYGIKPTNVVYKKAAMSEYISSGFSLMGLIFELNFTTN